MPLSNPSLYQLDVLDFSTTKSKLIAFWPFNDNGKDVVASHDVGVSTGSFVSDRFERSSSALIAINPSLSWGGSSIMFNTDFTITGWVYLNTYNWYNSDDSNLFQIFASNNWIVASLVTLSKSSNALSILIKNNDVDFYHISTTVLSLNRWYHVTYTQKAYTSSIYVNTILVSQQTSPFLAYAGLYTGTFRIGWLNGSLDDVKVFNKALDNYEICENYNSRY